VDLEEEGIVKHGHQGWTIRRAARRPTALELPVDIGFSNGMRRRHAWLCWDRLREKRSWQAGHGGNAHRTEERPPRQAILENQKCIQFVSHD